MVVTAASLTRCCVRQGSWQRIGGESPPLERSSQPSQPRVMRGVLRGPTEAFTGETTGQVLSCETGLIPRCRSRSADEKATSPIAYWLGWENLAQSETLCTWRSSLRGTWEVSLARGLVPGRLGKAEAVRRACTWVRSRMRS